MRNIDSTQLANEKAFLKFLNLFKGKENANLIRLIDFKLSEESKTIYLFKENPNTTRTLLNFDHKEYKLRGLNIEVRSIIKDILRGVLFLHSNNMAFGIFLPQFAYTGKRIKFDLLEMKLKLAIESDIEIDSPESDFNAIGMLVSFSTMVIIQTMHTMLKRYHAEAWSKKSD